jgi:hypothetical protein
MTTAQRSLRLQTYRTSDLTNFTYNKGEVFYDADQGSLRLFDGVTTGGKIIGGSGAVTSVGSTPPSSPTVGQLWLSTDTGNLYVYYVDINGGHWVQPLLTSAPSSSGYSLPAATFNTLGGVIADGTTIKVNSGGVISYVNAYSFTNSNLQGNTVLQHSIDVVTNITSVAGGTATFDWSSGSATYYITNISSNFTANFLNIPTTNNCLYVYSIALVQGSTPYVPNSTVNINSVGYTVNWAGGTAPVGIANETDLVVLTLFRVSNNWTIVGTYTTNGV